MDKTKEVYKNYGNGYGDVITEKGYELWNAKIICSHHIISPPGGGVKCSKCKGWFCY